MDVELTDLSDSTFRFDENPYTEASPISLNRLKELAQGSHVVEDLQPEFAPPVPELLHAATKLEKYGYEMEFCGKVVDTIGGEDGIVINGVYCLGDINPEIWSEFVESIAYNSAHILRKEDYLYCAW